jgi:mevalonate kinase
MTQVIVSAPGKLVVFGEHAVVYGYPCIVTAVDQRIFVTIEKIEGSFIEITAPDVNVKEYKRDIEDLGKGTIEKPVQFIEIACAYFFKKYKVKHGVHIKTKSEFSPLFGFGSSSAVTICTLKSLAVLFGISLSKKELFDLAYSVVLSIQKKGSGVDVAAGVYGGTLYFVKGGKVIKPLQIKSLPLLVGYSGIKADTVEILTAVSKKAEKYPSIIKDIYKMIGLLITPAKKVIEKKDWKMVGELMNFNQGYLESLGVSSQKLSQMIYAALNKGAYGAKLSGAGGGDCIIALSHKNQEESVKKAIESVGGMILKVKAHEEGVRVEYDN